MWQRGLEFPKQHWELYSIRKDCNASRKVLPDKIAMAMRTSSDFNKSVIDTSSIKADGFNDYKTLIYILQP